MKIKLLFYLMLVGVLGYAGAMMEEVAGAGVLVDECGGVTSFGRTKIPVNSMGGPLESVELPQDKIEFLRKEYQGKSGNEALLRNGPLLYEILKQLGLKVEVTNAEETVEECIAPYIRVSYTDYAMNIIHHDDDLSIQLIRQLKECKLFHNIGIDHIKVLFDRTEIRTHLIEPNLLDPTEKEFYGQEVKLEKSSYSVNAHSQICIYLTKNNFLPYQISLDDQPIYDESIKYPLFETLCWISKMCESTYAENNIPFPKHSEYTPDNTTKFQQDILPLLRLNLSCLKPRPSIDF